MLKPIDEARIKEITSLPIDQTGKSELMFYLCAVLKDRESASPLIQQLGEGLAFIGRQFCVNHPEEGGDFTPCTQTEMCITEYCLPCYAKTILRKSEYEVWNQPQPGREGGEQK